MKRLLTVLAALLGVAVAALAQGSPVEINQTYEGFDAIDVSYNYEVSLHKSNSYSTKVTADPSIKDYVKTYVKGSVLYVEMDEKYFPSELKKAMKTKGYVLPVLKVDVYMPSYNKLILRGNARLSHYDAVDVEGKFAVVLSDYASLPEFNFNAGEAVVEISNHSSAKLNINADKASLTSTNSSAVTSSIEAKNLKVETSGTSKVNVTCVIKDVSVKSTGASKLVFEGTASGLTVNGGNMSSIDSDALEVKEAFVSLSGSSECYVNATDKLKLDLSGSSHLVFNSNPSIDIVRVITSTLTRRADTKKK